MPLHPLIVHFPIALLIVGTVAQLVALFKPDFFDKAATYLLGLGWISGWIAYFTGDGAEEFAERTQNKDIEALVSTHETLALVSLILFAVALILKWLAYRKPAAFWKPLVIVVCLSGAVLVGVAGHYGGRMAYELPASTTVEQKDKD